MRAIFADSAIFLASEFKDQALVRARKGGEPGNETR